MSPSPFFGFIATRLLALTASIGGTMYRPDEAADAFVARADGRAAAAAEAGGDRVEWAAS